MTCRAVRGSLPLSSLPGKKHVARYCMYNYFPHPSNLRQSSGCVNLQINEGPAGYGIYLMVLEVLRDAPGYRYSPDPKVWAYLLHLQDVSQVERVLKNYGLFDYDDDGLVFSPWLQQQLGDYDEVKKRRAEAGRKGAASRWHGKTPEDGKAIALPSNEDGKAIAYNITKSNVISPNVTSPSGGDSWRDVFLEERMGINEELFHTLCSLHDNQDGHCYGYLLQECWRRGISLNAFNFILSHSNNAEREHPTYKAFCELCKRVDREKYQVKMPDNFYLSKLFEL